jgi:hypothetical protein
VGGEGRRSIHLSIWPNQGFPAPLSALFPSAAAAAARAFSVGACNELFLELARLRRGLVTSAG